jgi:RNA polymerase sigma factor (TIGR02999 family)
MSGIETRPSGDVTCLLLAWGAGNEAALESLLPLVYEELRSLAARHLRKERQTHTLQRTALVHEAYVRLVDQKQVQWRSRSQFFALASQMMRRVLVDHARKHVSQKRGGGAARVSLDATGAQAAIDRTPLDALSLSADSGVDLAAIDDALQRLEQMDPRLCRLVELRFFGGLSVEDTADVLGISPATVKREWRTARAWLQRELAPGILS